jgi:hypothetical protein
MDRFTVFSEGSYEPKAEITTDEAIERLGIIEDLIESGELMPPDIKQDDEVFFIYKNSQVLAGIVESVFTQYDADTQKYYYHLLIRNSFYGLLADYPAADFGVTWFKTRAEADDKLGDIELI